MPRWSILMFALAATTPFPGSAATTPPSDATRISYRSPQEALDALRAKPGTTLRQENDWWVIRDPEDHAIWSITLPAHPAHPTAVKRTPYIHDGELMLGMDVKCGAKKDVCDAVVDQFMAINQRLGERMRNGGEAAASPESP